MALSLSAPVTLSDVQPSQPSRFILGMRVDATSYARATDQIVQWSRENQGRMVVAANVHVTMEAYDDPRFRAIINNADLVTPDGVPLVWALRALGVSGAERVYGPDLTLHVCAAAAEQGIPIALYGGTEASLADFVEVLQDRFPGIQIVGCIAPPFRPLTPEEDAAYTEQLVASGARILFVGIGCPKQEKWIADHLDRIPAVMLGVGAAFDFHSGRVRQAPAWMQRMGLEWFFRLMMEPRRLWRRYAKHNPRFLLLFFKQWLHSRYRSRAGKSMRR